MNGHIVTQRDAYFTLNGEYLHTVGARLRFDPQGVPVGGWLAVWAYDKELSALKSGRPYQDGELAYRVNMTQYCAGEDLEWRFPVTWGDVEIVEPIARELDRLQLSDNDEGRRSDEVVLLLRHFTRAEPPAASAREPVYVLELAQ